MGIRKYSILLVNIKYLYLLQLYLQLLHFVLSKDLNKNFIINN